MKSAAVPGLPTLSLDKPGWTLRAWQALDAPALAEHANNPAVWRNMSDGFPHPYTLQIAQHWVTQGHIDFGGDNWAISFNGQAVGGCGMHRGRGPQACTAEIGYWLAQPYWGHGVGTAVARLLSQRALHNPAVMRVFAPVHADNPASMRVLEKSGFQREALMRLSVLKAGTPIDRVMMVLLRPGAVSGEPALPTLA